jgi:hypothetical protein
MGRGGQAAMGAPAALWLRGRAEDGEKKEIRNEYDMWAHWL